MSKAVVIMSGGMDSTTLLYGVKEQGVDVYALSFNYGQKHKKELECAKATCEALGVPHRVVDLSTVGELLDSALTNLERLVPEGHYAADNMKATVVPNRNMIMLSIAVGHAISIGADRVFYGAHSGDHAIYPDCRPEFVTAMQHVISLCDWKSVELIAPFLLMDKGDIAILGNELGVDYSKTWTCYVGGEKACGKCGADIERVLAFHKAGIVDPVEYEEGWDAVLKRALSMTEN